MKFSIVATFSGYSISGYCHETTIDDIARDLKEFESAGLSIDVSEPGDSEYEYLGHENQKVTFSTDDNDKWYWKTRYGQPCDERFDTELEARKHAARELNKPWLLAKDVTVSGILDKADFKRFCDSVGCWAEDVQTMDTLGGPLAPWGGIVADISFRMEADLLPLSGFQAAHGSDEAPEKGQ